MRGEDEKFGKAISAAALAGRIDNSENRKSRLK